MKILVPIDDRLFAEVLFAFLSKQEWPRGSTFRLIHVISPTQAAFVWPGNVLEESAHELVNTAVQRFQKHFSDCQCEGEVLHGFVAATIERIAAEWPADLVAIGSHARSAIGKAFMGSVSAHVAKHTQCPVIVLRPPLITGNATNGGDPEIEPIWLEEMSPEHERYFLSHATEHPFPPDGTDWSRLVAMRLEHEYHHPKKECAECQDLITKLHSLGSPVPHEREGSRRAWQHWFLPGPAQYKPALEGEDDAGIHALKILSQLDKNAALQKAEKDWLENRIKVWKAKAGKHWISENSEQWETGTPIQQRNMKLLTATTPEVKHDSKEA